MGLAGRKPVLPAPTESLVDESTVEESPVVEEAATDLSQQSDRTHYSIPDDGSPITISTKKLIPKVNQGTKSNQTSQTSLLIEYFEGGKGSDPTRRPSVRVKVIPSSKHKHKEKGDDHLVRTEAREGLSGTRLTSRRISLSASDAPIAPGDSDGSLLESLHLPPAEKAAPLHTAIPQESDVSSMSASPEARYIAAPSDISSMPADSLLGAPQSALFAPPPKGPEGSNISSLPAEESFLSGSGVGEASHLKPPVVPRERNLSNERLTQKVIEKLSNKPRPDTVKMGYAQGLTGASRTAGREVGAAPYERAAMKAKHFRETDSTLTDATEPSAISNSVLSAGAHSDYSARSAATNHSINNPKLLQTVEDAIRRLILPELKELKKDQRQHSRSKHEKDYSDLSESSGARRKSGRRSTSGEKARRRRSSKDHAEPSGARRRKSSHRDVGYDSLSDASSKHEASISSISAEDLKKPSKSHRPRDLVAAGLVGAGLTAAALESKESDDSLQRRRRRKRSKSQSSRSASIAESDEVFHKYHVPPMPMQSDINSELTRSSILSSNTETSPAPVPREVQDVARATRGEDPPGVMTPPRQSGDLKTALGMHHGNFSEHNLSAQKLVYDDVVEDDMTLSPETDRYQTFSAEDLLEDPERMRQYERNLHTQHPIRRGLSPIQSVASYQTTEPNRNSLIRRSADSLASMKRRQQQLKEEVSISSLQSPSPDLRKPRPQGISLENRSEIMGQHEEDTTRSPEFQSIGIHDRLGDDGHGHPRGALPVDEGSWNDKRFSTTTDQSSEAQYVDKVTSGQHVVPMAGAKAEIVPAPFGVESGVASLVEPSILSTRESEPSSTGSFVQEKGSFHSLPREIGGARGFSPIKEQPATAKSDGSLRQPRYSRHIGLSPAQSPAQSYEEHQEAYAPAARPPSRSPASLPKDSANVEGSPQSEITTNPSVIQGPIGGLGAGHPDPWLAGTASPPLQSQAGMSRDLDLVPEGLNVSQRNTYEPKHHTYVIGQPLPIPAGVKDEGYATGEGDTYSPPPVPTSLMKTGPTGMAAYEFDDEFDAQMDDPFTTKRNQYMSGLSQGMSPLYDGATGKGIDRIQSRDILALMEHLTVRDAQRNARDTEILVTLVRSAAEMRNSFEEMKQFIAEQDAMMMQTADKQHAQTQKAISGPRQMPSKPRTVVTRTTSQDDLPNKRRNVFKRALQGLGSKNTAELQNIESMLMQLLDEVEALRSQQTSQAPTIEPRSNSLASDDVVRPPTETGYEPEGRAGTASSGGDRSAFFSNNSSRQGHYGAARRVPENRVSTVMEGDEEYDDFHAPRQLPDGQRTPTAPSPLDEYYKRGQSDPLHTPPRMHDDEEITPTSYNSADKKHKTFSSFLPKQFVSRWSKTTASTEPEYRQSTLSKAPPYSHVTQSGSNLHDYEYEHHEDDRLRSAASLQDEAYHRHQENRPPSPLVPSAISDNPKYHAHRNSQNLQHPQPRQGPTGRYGDHLENAAHSYYTDEALSPVSQVSSHRWENINQNPHRSQQSYVPHSLSPIADQERTNSASSLTRRNNGPPRPPKIAETSSDLNEPLVPQRPSKGPQGTMSPSTYVDDVRAARAGSPAFDKSPVAALRGPGAMGNVGRKPSGPRPLSASSNKDTTKRARFTESPAQNIGEQY